MATGLVLVAGLLCVLWAAGVTPTGIGGTRATGVAALALGFAASAGAACLL